MTKSRWIVLLALALALVSGPAFAQATAASSLAGTVVDKDGGVVPGVTVVAKNIATAESQTTTTNSSGAFSFPSMSPGSYSVTISLQGFKKIEVTGVRLLAGSPANLAKQVLEIGTLNEVVEVRGTTDLVRTQSPAVTSTISTEFISSLPRSDRNALSFLIFLPGVQTSGGAQNSRSSTIAGLPQNTLNISIDGVTTGNLLQSTDGFFTLVTPRLDAVEEVTLSTAATGADASSNGATQVKFVTRSGTNQFSSSIYDYFKHKALNSNTFFNKEINGLPRPRITVQQYGGRVGGPIVIPGLFDGHGKAFFFFNQEEIWQPNQTSRSRTVARVAAMNGDFTYNNSAPRTVNLYAAAANAVSIGGNTLITAGANNSPDPTIAALLGKIRAAATSTGNLQQSATAPNTETFNYQVTVASKRHSPTGRVDLNLTPKHRLSGTYYWQRLLDSPDTLNNADPTFPGFPAQAGQTSFRTTGSSTLRSTLSTNMVNEALVGWQWSPVSFFTDANPSMFTSPDANQDGYALNLGFVTNAHPGNAAGTQARNTINWNIDDNLNWLKGDHSLKFGFSFTRISSWLDNTTVVPGVTLGLSTSGTADPALGFFNATQFPTATSTDLGNARSLYGMLTGRISALPGTGRLNNEGTQYVFNGLDRDAERQDNYSAYASDSWRWKPNVTVTAGVRYVIQMPMVATVGRLTGSQLTDICGISGIGASPLDRTCNINKPGFVGNPSFTTASFAPLTSDTKGYNLDTNNFAPNVGINWRPVVKSGIGRAILGDPEQATVSGGYSRSFNLERVDRFRTVYVGNPGSTTPATRGFTAGNFPIADDALGLPLLFSQKSRITIPAFQQAPTFPLTALSSQGIFVFDQNIRTPYTDSWTVGLQRAVSRDMAVEVRYLGNVNKDPWTSENWNFVNYIETGLVGTNTIDNVSNQFAKAQSNLQANIAAGNGATFAFTGAPGTTPLPIFLAHFSAQPIANAGNTALYTSTQWTNSTWTDRLNPFSPDPQGIANALWTGSSGAFKVNGVDSGIYPANFWTMNPAVQSANVTRNLGSSKYNSMQVDLRRRFSQGLATQVSYTYARGTSFTNNDLHFGLQERRSTLIPHAIKMLWTWDLPVGRGRRFGTNMNKWMDGAIGGWQFSGSGRVQVPVFRLQNTRLVGMSHDEAQSLFKQIRLDISPTGVVTVWDMPKEIVDNTIRAYSTSATVAGYYTQGAPTGRYFAPASRPAGFDSATDPGCIGVYAEDCAPDMFFYGNWFGEFDFKLLKRFNLPGKATFEFDVEVFNALKATNFANQMTPSSSNNVFRVTGQDSNARTGQLVWRVTW